MKTRSSRVKINCRPEKNAFRTDYIYMHLTLTKPLSCIHSKICISVECVNFNIHPEDLWRRNIEKLKTCQIFQLGGKSIVLNVGKLRVHFVCVGECVAAAGKVEINLHSLLPAIASLLSGITPTLSTINFSLLAQPRLFKQSNTYKINRSEKPKKV